MDDAAPGRTMIVVGALTVLVGAIPLLAMAGVLPQAPHEPSDPAPAWMGWLIGFMFTGAGLMVIARGIWGGASATDGALAPTAPKALRVLNNLFGVGIAGGLAALFTWVAFGPGPRHFIVGIDGLFFRTSGETIGRVMFGFGAVLGWFIMAAMLRETLRRWRQSAKA